MGLLQNNKVFEKEKTLKKDEDSFKRFISYSLVFHVLMMLALFISNKFNLPIWKKPPQQATVVWTQTVKRPKPTIPDKLPPPMVPLKKAQEAKPDEINVKKPTPVVKKEEKEESAADKMKKALEKIKSQVKDDRPAPREDNFATSDDKKPQGTLSDSEILALQASSIYSAYIQQIKETVQNNFIWYKTGKNFVASVSMNIDPQGNISNIKIEKSSGDFSYDQSTLRAVQKSSPLPAPPAELVSMFLQERAVINFDRQGL